MVFDDFISLHPFGASALKALIAQLREQQLLAVYEQIESQTDERAHQLDEQVRKTLASFPDALRAYNELEALDGSSQVRIHDAIWREAFGLGLTIGHALLQAERGDDGQ